MFVFVDPAKSVNRSILKQRCSGFGVGSDSQEKHGPHGVRVQSPASSVVSRNILIDHALLDPTPRANGGRRHVADAWISSP
jgi:hypothetical protein